MNHTDDRYRRAYAARHITLDELEAGVRETVRSYLEGQGFIVERRDGARTTTYFDVDGMINGTKVRDGLVRNIRESSIVCDPECRSRAAVTALNMELFERFNFSSFAGFEKVIYRLGELAKK